jgi:hypothetical protein
MPQSDHSARRGPKRRSDCTRSTSSRLGTAGEATAALSDGLDYHPGQPAKPGATTTRSRARGAASTPRSASPVDGVGLVLWPTPQPTTQPVPGERCGLGVVGVDGVIDRAPGADPHSDNDSANDTEVSDVAVSESPCIHNG